MRLLGAEPLLIARGSGLPAPAGDQRRVVTPADAIGSGAGLLVGTPVTAAEDPRAARGLRGDCAALAPGRRLSGAARPVQRTACAASAKAVANRRRRADQRAVAFGSPGPGTSCFVLAHVDEVVAALRVQDALLCLPGVGPQRLGRFMRHANISPTRRIRGLGTQSDRHVPGPRPVSRLCRSGPSGVGKSTVVARLLQQRPDIWLSRVGPPAPPRPGERHGREYFFVSPEEFVAQGQAGICSRASFAGNSWRPRVDRCRSTSPPGSPSCWRSSSKAPGRSGAAMPEAVLVFLAPPSGKSPNAGWSAEALRMTPRWPPGWLARTPNWPPDEFDHGPQRGTSMWPRPNWAR